MESTDFQCAHKVRKQLGQTKHVSNIHNDITMLTSKTMCTLSLITIMMMIIIIMAKDEINVPIALSAFRDNQ